MSVIHALASVARGAARALSLASVAGLVGLAACTDPGAVCGARRATVERVIDGDTIALDGGQIVRYLLVDAPEASGDRRCYGANAARFNADLVLGKTVQLDHDGDGPCRDSFGRVLAYVTIDGQDVNRLLIERGYACVLHIPPAGDTRVDELRALEAQARAAGRGLWGSCQPIPCR